MLLVALQWVLLLVLMLLVALQWVLFLKERQPFLRLLFVHKSFNLTLYHSCLLNILPILQGAATEEEHFLPLAVIDPLQQALLPPGPLSQFHFPQNDPHAISQHTLLLLG